MADKTNKGPGEKKEPSTSSAPASATPTPKPSSIEPPPVEKGTSKKQDESAKAENANSQKPSDDQKEKPPASSAASSPINRSWMAIGITLGVLIALAAIYVGGPWASKSAKDPSTALSTQILDLEKRLSAVEKTISTGPVTGAETEKNAQSVAALRKALEGLEKRVEAMSPRSANDVPMSNPQTPLQAPSETVDGARLSAALDLVVALEERVAALESGNGAIPDIPFNVTERLVRLEKVINSGLLERISSLEEVVPDTASHEDLRDVEKRLFKLENKKSDPTVAHAAQSMAVASLSRAVLSARPFEAELDLLERLIPGTEEVKHLRRYSESGLESREVLARDFDDLALQALREARLAKADDWSSRFWAWTQSVITIRRTDSDGDDDMEAVINRIEERMVNGDLADALAESNKLTAVTDVLDNWRKRLQVRVQAEEVLQKLQARANQSVTGDQ